MKIMVVGGGGREHAIIKKIKENKEAAWADYYKLCLAGGTKGYFELLEYANLKNPFNEETIKEITENVMEEIAKQKNNI